MTNLMFPFVQMLPLDTEAILCNNTKMLREHLNICGDGLGDQNWDPDSEYVYDLYYQEMVTPGWIQDILSVRAYADEGELVCVDAGIRVEVEQLLLLGCCFCLRCLTWWSMKRRCMMMRMMKTMRPTGGMTTLMRKVMQKRTERNVMVVSLSFLLQSDVILCGMLQQRNVFAVDYWEEHSYSRGSWRHYQRELLRELSCRDDEDEGGCLYDSD